MRRTFFWPLVLAILTLVGLVAALVGGEPWRAVSWLALGAPLATIAILCRRVFTRR